ncbi:CD209 antigen-like [Mytilus trossulus]|uniref:CD209 antigen-like n=1 Tax=Mytilus trossulus TaxID=6551 RepID=UPI0030056E6E
MAANTFIYDEPYDQGKHKKGTQHCHVTNTNSDGLNNHYEDLDQVMTRISLANNDNNGDVQHTRLIHRNKRMVIGVLVGLFIGSLISGAVVFLILKYSTSISNIEGELNQENLDTYLTTEKYSNDTDSGLRMKIDHTPGTTKKYSGGVDTYSKVTKIERPGCSCDWYRFQGVYYWVSNHSSNFANAQTFCRNRRGYLVEIKTTVAYKFLQLLASTGDAERYWIGATNRPNGGPWKWDKSNTLVDPLLEDWEEGQPENKNEDCVTLEKTKEEVYQWHDWFCSSTHAFICQY